MSTRVADEESKDAPIASGPCRPMSIVSRSPSDYGPRAPAAIDQADSAPWLAEFAAAQAVHAAECTATYCTRCGRHACASCERAPVSDHAETCSRCRLRDAIRQMEIPPRYADALVHVAVRVRSVSARKLAARSLAAKAIVLMGGAGTGKTTLGVGMQIGLAQNEIAAVPRRRPSRMLFASAIDLGVARSHHRLGCGEAELVANAMRAGVLLLDDLGAEGARDADVIAQVIHERHNSNKATWITTGLNVAEVASRYGGGLERRIYEGAVLIDCDGGPAACGAP
jgi:DNA replication protein DnaC